MLQMLFRAGLGGAGPQLSSFRALKGPASFTAMPDPLQDDGPIISKATVDKVPAIKSMVDAAFSKYIDRIGKPPVGFVSLSQKSDSNADPSTVSVNIDILVVDTSTQGRGYGRMLMDHAENEARRKGILALTVYIISWDLWRLEDTMKKGLIGCFSGETSE
ncbi:hypothetical protein PMAA_030750 [Talaromyces marneffei ATCC 18224]|uniref:N-acetyltransferase domain-containing protein n=1 Tax=Talaromyces marneffei (strain ATCC 18224 / CBS 334.59 / QM 7333) TaxID=441960 RepID=B6Q4F3_TALMQ|nr:hypothetical protein PMAA_030750 [Talaromyces marneffei ATCC 18224]